jgi:uncharacterized protein (UPF0332 family)
MPPRSNRALGTVEQHLKKAESLEALARGHYDERRFDECAMWAFYAAVHFVNARLRQSGIPWIARHEDRDSLMLQDEKLKEFVCYESYRDCKELSEDARYGIQPTSEAEARGALRKLDDIKKVVLAAIASPPAPRII